MTVNALDEQLIIPCGGDEQLIIGCIGDEEYIFIGNEVTETGPGRGLEELSEKVLDVGGVKIQYNYLFIIILFLFIMFCFIFFLIYRKKKEE
jgi:hypothetical protein